MMESSSSSSSSSSAYSRSQVDQFLNYIQLPRHLHHAPPTLDLLKSLHTHMISTVPYENLSLHYNPLHVINIDPQFLFNKIVGEARGRGGYCMEVAILYSHLLRALGFDAYTVGARTRSRVEGVPQGDFPGWVHIVNIVTFPDGTRYHDDVAFGGDGATMPMPMLLLDEAQQQPVHKNLGTQEIRLIRDWLPGQVKRDSPATTKNWIYQYRNSSDKEWNSFYAFVELEFTQADWEVVNWNASTNPALIHRNNPLCIKFLPRQELDGEGNKVIYGKRMLVNSVVKENLGGRTQVIQVCRDEEERVEALRRWFGLQLTREEIEGIRGFRTEIVRNEMNG